MEKEKHLDENTEKTTVEKVEETLSDKIQEVILKTVEEWAEELEIPLWLLYATRIQHSWVHGKTMSREEFEQAVARTRLLEVR